MSLFPQTLIVPNPIADTIGPIVDALAPQGGTVGLPTIASIGATVGGSPIIEIDANVLDPNAGSLVDTNIAIGNADASTSLDLDLLAGASPTLPTLTPVLSDAVDPLLGAVQTIGTGILAPIVDLDPIASPVVDIDVTLGSGSTQVDLDVDIPVATETPSSTAPEATDGNSSDPVTEPTVDVIPVDAPNTPPTAGHPDQPALPDVVDEVIDALPDVVDIGLGDGSTTSVTPVDEGTGGAPTTVPSTSIPPLDSGGTATGPSATDVGQGSATCGSATPPTTGASPGGGVDAGVPSIGTPATSLPGSLQGTAGDVGNTTTGGAVKVPGWSSPTIDMAGRGFVEGGSGVDTVMGLGGNDTVHGHGGDDMVLGNQGNDFVYGDAGDDLCHGGRNDDYVSGGDGDDDIWGDLGDDVLDGGEGADTFFFGLNSGNDVILDFDYAQGDRLDFQGQSYAVADVDGNAIVTLSGGGAVVLAGVTGAEFSSFGFA